MGEILYWGRRALRSYALALLVGGIVTLTSLLSIMTLEAGAAEWMLLLVGLAMIGIPYLLVLSTDYQVTSRKATQKIGILSRRTSEIDLADVRNIQMSQGIAERLFGLGTVMISTAGQSGFEVQFQGIANPAEVADIIRKARDKLRVST